MYCKDNKPDEDIINQYSEMSIKEDDFKNTISEELVNAIEKPQSSLTFNQPTTSQQSVKMEF